MARNERIVRYSADELAKLPSLTDHARVGAMAQDEVERMADAEDGPLSDGWEKTIVLGVPEPKRDVHIRLDAEVLRWFQSPGPGYQTRINEVLRTFVRAQPRAPGKPMTRNE